MILDALLRFSDNQALTGTAVSDNVIDFGLGTALNPQIPTPAQGGGARDMGIGDSPALKFVVQVGTAITGTAPTLQISLQGAPDNGSGVPGAFATWWSSPVYVAADLVAGARLFDMDMPRPPQGVAVPRFIRLNYTGGGTIAAGTVSAYLVLDRDDQMYNATNNAILGGYRAGLNVAN